MIVRFLESSRAIWMCTAFNISMPLWKETIIAGLCDLNCPIKVLAQTEIPARKRICLYLSMEEWLQSKAAAILAAILLFFLHHRHQRHVLSFLRIYSTSTLHQRHMGLASAGLASTPHLPHIGRKSAWHWLHIVLTGAPHGLDIGTTSASKWW